MTKACELYGAARLMLVPWAERRRCVASWGSRTREQATGGPRARRTAAGGRRMRIERCRGTVRTIRRGPVPSRRIPEDSLRRVAFFSRTATLAAALALAAACG